MASFPLLVEVTHISPGSNGSDTSFIHAREFRKEGGASHVVIEAKGATDEITRGHQVLTVERAPLGTHQYKLAPKVN